MGRTKKQSNKAIRRIICKTGLEQISTNTVIRNAGLKKEVSRLKKESEDKTKTINGLNDENFELKNQVRNLEYNGSHRVLHVTRPRQCYDLVTARSKTSRILLWMDTLKELNDGTVLSNEACTDLIRRLQKSCDDKEKKILNEMETAEFFLALGISQNKFKLIYHLLRSYEVAVPFAPYSKFLSFIQEKPDGAFVAVKKNDGTIGTVASEVKKLMTVRLQRLYDAEQLVYEKLGSSAIKVKICLVGDKGKGTTKFCFQPQVKEKNHSFRVLSVIGLWHGADDRESLNHYLNAVYNNEDSQMPNGSVIQQLKDCHTIELNKVKCSVEFYLTGDFMFVYNFMGFKGQNSNYFCFYCKFYSRTTAEVIHFHSNEKTRWKNFTRNCDSRNMTVDAASSLKDLKKIGFKSESLMPIQYSNIIMPLLHIFMGLAVDIQKRFRGLLSPEETETMIRFLQSIGIRMRNYWEAFSGNAVSKLMKNMDEFLAVLPNENAELNNMKDIFKKLSVVYKFVFVAEINDQVMLEQELKNLADAYKNGEFSKEFTITPKAHTLICHASQQLQRHGTIMLFSEQGQEALHNIMNKDLIRIQSMPSIERQLELLIRFHSMRVMFFDNE